MRVQVTLIDPRWDSSRDVVVEADDSVPTGSVLEELLARAGAAAGPAVADDPRVISLAGRRATAVAAKEVPRTDQQVYLHGMPLDPRTPVGESGIKEGSLLSVGDPAPSILLEPEGSHEVRVVTGTGAGAVHRVELGDGTIGSDPDAVVTLGDDRIPPVAVTFSVGVEGSVVVRPTAGAAQVLAEHFPHADPALALDRERLAEDEDTAWPVGGQLALGDLILELELVEPPDAALADSAEPGWLDYNRPPRLLPPERQTKFREPVPPDDSFHRSLPWLVMIAPVFLAILMAFIFDNPRYLTMALFSPMMLLASHFQNKKQGKITYRAALAKYKERKAALAEDLAQAMVDEKLGRRLEAPDPALALLIASGPRARLWERRTTDPDYLSVRLGVGDLESEVTLEDPMAMEHRRTTRQIAHDVPVTVSLRERGVLGIAGRDGLPRQVASWLVSQLAVLQSPRDTQFYVLTDTRGADDWEWLRWLPHAHPQLGQDTVVTIGTDAETCARRIAELSQLLAARQQAVAEARGDVAFPDVIVVFDGARRLRTLPGVVALLKQGPNVSLYSVCLDVDERLLPEEASAVVLETPAGLALRQQRVTVVDDITPDLVAQPWLHRVARALAPIRDISGNEGDSVLPDACRLTEVMELEPLSPEVIKARWSLSPRSTEAVVGISLDGPFAIDMRRDGPHGLVAGTTGAGKSELLQSIVASLAVANRPDGMTFVLVDYKGGAAFKDCVDLPHTVGMVTDLDTHLVERALVSLGAELHRREHILAEAGAKDIEDYVDIAAKRPGTLPDMPRLLIVIDEFASMARELPDFVTGLVNIAQRGRSLGIHLILATQRPGGVVSPEIRANTNLRIALRVTDASESSDVIDAPDAGMISKSTPGRAYVRLGASSLVPFQSGRVGGRRPGVAQQSAPRPWLVPLGADELSQPLPERPRAEVADDAEVTDLKVLVDSIRKANDELGLPPQHSPWLPALTTEVLLDDLLDGVTPGSYPHLTPAPWAVEDLPAEQARRNATIDWSEFAHLSVIGGPRSGRSQTLRTIAGSVARTASPSDVHLYCLDCGNGALLPLAELPHCGAVVQRTQSDRALRLLSRLMAELARRQEVLSSGGFASLDELRATLPEKEGMPHILFLLDRWEGFLGSIAEADGGSPMDHVQTLLREGASVGIHVVITGDRQLGSTRIASLVEDKIALRLPDKSDYGLVGLRPRQLPDEVPEGRGFRNDSGLELQVALLDADLSGQAQARALRDLGARLKEQYAAVPRERLPFRLDVLPGRVRFDEAWELRHDPTPRPLWAMVGVGGDELAAQGLDLAETNVAVIAGAPKAGRSTALLCAAESLLRGGTDVVVAAPRKSPLRDLEGRAGVRHVFTDVTIEEAELRELMDTATGRPVVFIADDGELLKDVGAKDYLKLLTRRGADHGQAIILGGDSSEIGGGFTGWQVDVKGRQGVLISAQSMTEGELIGLRLPRSAVGPLGAPGRALANVGDGVLRTVQVALPQ